MKIIKIPKTPAKAFDKHREVSDLVRNQVRHAHKELHDWWRIVGGIDPNQIQTEQQAAEYVRTITRILHPEGAHTSRIPLSPAPKSGVWLTDPIEGSKRKGRKKR
jgi:hypothetical protein